MKSTSQSHSKCLAFASLLMAFFLVLSTLISPQTIPVTYAKYVTTENAGTVTLSITHAHALLTTGFKLRRALETGTTTSGAADSYDALPTDSTITEVYFGKTSEYASKISGKTGVDVSLYGDGSIKLYKVGTVAYIVSDRTIATSDDFSCAFTQFTSLKKVHFSEDFDTSRAKTFAYLFYNCRSLASVENLNSFDTRNATVMQSMFYTSNDDNKPNTALTSLDVNSFNTSNVTDMGSMFRNCAGFTALNVKGFNTAKVTDLGGMFAGCKKLSSIDVTGFNTSSVKTMELMFADCTGLKTIDLRSFSCKSLTKMSQMFLNCSNLTTIYADYGFDCRSCSTPVATDETDENGKYTIDSKFDNIFKGCTKLVGGSGTKYDEKIVHNLRAVVDVSLAVEQNVFKSSKGYFTHYSSADGGDTYLTTGQAFNAAIKTLANGSDIAYSTNDTKIKYIYFGKTGSYNVSGMKSVSVSAGTGAVTAYWDAGSGKIYVLSDSTIVFNTSSDYMFDSFGSLEGIYFNSISTSAVRTMQRMFGYCPKLKNLNLRLFETQNVVDYGSCFTGDSSLDLNTVNNLIIPYLNTDKARDIGGLFQNCSGIQGAVNMSNLHSAKAETIASLIEGCTGITSINISGFSAENVYNIDRMFSGCTSLTTIHTSSSLNLNTDKITNDTDVFKNCTRLIGGNGTKFTSAHIDKSYAHTDVADAPGYFTSIASGYSLMSVALTMNTAVPEENVSETDAAVSQSDSVTSKATSVTHTVPGTTTIASSTTIVTTTSIVESTTVTSATDAYSDATSATSPAESTTISYTSDAVTSATSATSVASETTASGETSAIFSDTTATTEPTSTTVVTTTTATVATTTTASTVTTSATVTSAQSEE